MKHLSTQKYHLLFLRNYNRFSPINKHLCPCFHINCFPHNKRIIICINIMIHCFEHIPVYHSPLFHFRQNQIIYIFSKFILSNICCKRNPNCLFISICKFFPYLFSLNFLRIYFPSQLRLICIFPLQHFKQLPM